MIFIEEKEHGKSFFELFDEFLADKNFSNDRKRGMQVLKRDVWRYMKFQQEVCKRQDFTFNVNDVTKFDIDDFRDYLENEKTLMARHKRLFKQMIDEQPNGIRKGHSDIEVRGLNTIVTLMKKLRSFFSWCYEKGKTITIDKLEDGVFLYHAGTKKEAGVLKTNGGRVLGVCAKGETVEKARKKAYRNVEKIHFDGMQYRHDIGIKYNAKG